MSTIDDAVKRCRDFLDGSASSAECDDAYAALAELEAIAKWAADARCYLESMACRYRRDGDRHGEQETAARLVRHPEITKRCVYGIGEGSKCRFHQLAGGECRTGAPTVRQAARARSPLDGADAQALEGALSMTERERDSALAEVARLRGAAPSRAERLSVLPTSEPAENLVAELMAEARQPPTTSRLQPANPHPSDYHAEPYAHECVPMTPKEAQDKLDEKLVQARRASTADLSPTEIRIADAGGRLVVDPNGYGTVYPTRDAAREDANPHPSGCHTAAPGERDCYSDGHASCSSCSRRTERDEEWWREGGLVEPAWPSDDEERASMRAGRSWDP